MLKITPFTNLWQLGLLFILNILDFITTYCAIGMGGEEVNPLMLYIMVETGTIWSLLWAKMLLLTIVVPYFLLVAYKHEWIIKYVRDGFITFMGYSLIIMNLFYSYIFVHNLTIIYTLTTWRV